MIIIWKSAKSIDKKKSLNLMHNPINKKGKGLNTEKIWNETFAKSSSHATINNDE